MYYKYIIYPIIFIIDLTLNDIYNFIKIYQFALDSYKNAKYYFKKSLSNPNSLNDLG